MNQESTNTEVPGTSSRNRTFLSEPPNKRVVLRTSASTLLKGLGNFLCRRCNKVQDLSPSDPPTWMEWIDSYLDKKGLHYEKFFRKGSIVFLYMICRDSISPEITSKSEFKATFLACAFVTYSYLTLYDYYPVRLFIVAGMSKLFSHRCISIALSMSSKMMMISVNRQYYFEVLNDLKAEAELEEGKMNVQKCMPILAGRGYIKI